MAYQMIFRPGKEGFEKTDRSTSPTLKEAQAVVGGLIQGVPNRIKIDGQPVQIWVNEEGLIHGMPVNEALMDWMREYGYVHQQPLVGNALVLVGRSAQVR